MFLGFLMFAGCRSKMAHNVLMLALSDVAATPSHHKCNKTFHSATDFPRENPEVAIEANRCYLPFYPKVHLAILFSFLPFYGHLEKK
jgi:hypothetical protein